MKKINYLSIISLTMFLLGVLLIPFAKNLEARELAKPVVSYKSLNQFEKNGLWQGDGQNIWNLNTGHVGIGESNPQATLHIKHSANSKSAFPLLIVGEQKNSLFKINHLGVIEVGKISSENVLPGTLSGNGFTFSHPVDFSSVINANFGINVSGSNIILDALGSAIEWGNGAYLAQNLNHFTFAGGGNYYFDNAIGIKIDQPQANLHIRENNTNISFIDDSNIIIEGNSARIDLLSKEYGDSKINFRNFGGVASISYNGPAHPYKSNYLVFSSSKGFYFNNDVSVNGSLSAQFKAENGQPGLTKSYNLKDASGAHCQMHFASGLLVESDCVEVNPALIDPTIID